MLSLSAQGHDVRFVNESASVQELPTKDVQTITTPDQEKAKAWSKEKADQGYTVSTTYANGQYTVIAIKQSANAAKCRLQEKYPRDEKNVTELGNVSLYEIKEISKK